VPFEASLRDCIAGLEIKFTRKGNGGSNPSLSAKLQILKRQRVF
jgi:hypothetical protein